MSVEGPLDANGVVLDFDTLQAVVRTEVIDAWDHRDLNQVLDNPTAELLAHRAWELLAAAGIEPCRPAAVGDGATRGWTSSAEPEA